MAITFKVDGVTITAPYWSVISIALVSYLRSKAKVKYIRITVIGSYGGFRTALVPIDEFRKLFSKEKCYTFNHDRLLALLDLSGGAFYKETALACIDEE